MQHNLNQKDSLPIPEFYEWRKMIVVFSIIMMAAGGYIYWFVTILKLVEWYANQAVMGEKAIESIAKLVSISLLMIGLLKTTLMQIFLKKADSERLVWFVVIVTIILPSLLLIVGKITQVYLPLLQETWGHYQPVAAMSLTKHYDALRQTHPFLPNLQLSFF